MADTPAAENSTARQGLWYLFVGGSSALLELAIFQGLYSLAGLAVAPANIVAVVIATVYNFLMNRSVTFRSTSNPLRSLVLYLLLFAANLALSTWAIGAMIALLRLTEAFSAVPLNKRGNA